MDDKFKEGDKVVLCGRLRFGGSRYRLGTVEAITPSGQVRLSDKSRFLIDKTCSRPYGYRIGDGGETIHPASEEYMQLYQEQELRDSVRRWANDLLVKLERMKLADLERAWQAIDHAEEVMNILDERS